MRTSGSVLITKKVSELEYLNLAMHDPKFYTYLWPKLITDTYLWPKLIMLFSNAQKIPNIKCTYNSQYTAHYVVS